MFTSGLSDLLVSKTDVFPDVFGQSVAKKQFKSSLLAGRHILIIGPPGVGKTTLARALASLLPEITVNDCDFNCDPQKPLCPKCRLGKKCATKKIAGLGRFVRVQGSPDLTVEDLLGDIDPVKALTFGPTSVEAFTPGKIFRANKGVLFFDELNRCNEKLQNALLQVLEEGVATIGSHMVDFPAEFVFVGTMNPEENAAVEKLSDVWMVLLDVVRMSYPESVNIEKEIVVKKGKSLSISFPDNLLQGFILFIHSLRENRDVQKKPSVRASFGVYERSQANALLSGRKTVSIADINDAMISVVAHRVELKPSIKYLTTPDVFVAKEFEKFCSEHKLGNGGGSL